MTPLRPIVYAMMLSLRRRYLERHIDGPFDLDLLPACRGACACM